MKTRPGVDPGPFLCTGFEQFVDKIQEADIFALFNIFHNNLPQLGGLDAYVLHLCRILSFFLLTIYIDL